MHECSTVEEDGQQGCHASVSQSLLLSLTNHFHCVFLSTVLQRMDVLLSGTQNTQTININITFGMTYQNYEDDRRA